MFKSAKNWLGRSNAETSWFKKYENITQKSGATNWDVRISVPSNQVAGGSGSSNGSLKQTIELPESTGQLQVNYNMYSIPDRLQILNSETGEIIFDSGNTSKKIGSGQVVNFNLGDSKGITILINGGVTKNKDTNFNYSIILNPDQIKVNDVEDSTVN